MVFDIKNAMMKPVQTAVQGFAKNSSGAKPPAQKPISNPFQLMQAGTNAIGNKIQGNVNTFKSNQKANNHMAASQKLNSQYGSIKPPSLKNSRSTEAPFGMDMTNPGVGEQYWDRNQDRWASNPQTDWAGQQLKELGGPGFGETYGQRNISSFGSPGQGQQFWNQVQGQFNEKGQFDGPNRADEAYQRMNQNMPGSLQPQFDSAFDRARDTAVGQMNSQAAARGAYGSSAALNNVGNVISDVESARAKAHADFALQNSADQRAWGNSLGQLGSSADASDRGAFGANLQGLGQFGDMAFGAEGMDLNRDQFGYNVASGVQGMQDNRIGNSISGALGLAGHDLNQANSGFNAAMGSQGAREGRIQGQFNNQMSYLDRMLPFLGGNYSDMLNADQDLFMNSINTRLGSTANAANNSANSRQETMGALQGGLDLATGIKQYAKS